MKTILTILLAFLLAAAAHAQQQIATRADKSFRGPFNAAPALASGETAVTLTDAQYAALNALRTANPAATQFTFDGQNFAVHPISQLSAQLLAQYNTLSPGEQLLFQPQLAAVTKLLAAGNVPEARLVIFLSGAGMPQDIATVRTNMLASFDSLFPPAP